MIEKEVKQKAHTNIGDLFLGVNFDQHNYQFLKKEIIMSENKKSISAKQMLRMYSNITLFIHINCQEIFITANIHYNLNRIFLKQGV